MRNQRLFAKQYLFGDAATAWDQYCAQHLETNHTRAAVRKLLYSQVVPIKHRTNTAFQKLCSAKQGRDQTVTLFSAYIVTTCEGTDITN